jgi:hypothetical protein
MACEAPLNLNINVLQTQSCCRVRGSYEHEPIPAHAKTELKDFLPQWCERPSASYRLVAVGTETVYPLSDESFVTVGRQASSKVVLSSLSVSRTHAALMHDSLNQTFLVDLGSSHGSFIGSERLTPYVPTLVTKKSLIRFGTCEIQYLLLTLCADECIMREAYQLETTEEREVFLNTQFNLRNACPTNGSFPTDEDSAFFGRLNTFNFTNIMKQHPPALKRLTVSCESVETCPDAQEQEYSSPISVDNVSDSSITMQQQGSPQQQSQQQSQSQSVPTRSPANFQNFSVQFQLSAFQLSDPSPNAFKPSPSVANCDLPGGNFGLSISPNGFTSHKDNSCFVKSDHTFIPAGSSLGSECSIKRCATMAGVYEEQESAAFAPSPAPGDAEASNMSFSPDPNLSFSPRQHMRRRMSEEPIDYGTVKERSGSRAMSLSFTPGEAVEAIECASVGGSSNGFISSGSMSECEEECDANKKKKVRFWEFPMEIPFPVTLVSFCG